MKTRYLILILFLISRVSYSQAIRQQKMDLPDGSKLIYQTINNELNGIYSIEKDGVTVLRGNYVSGKRVGNWYIFNNDKSIYARYNYDAHKLLSLDAKMLSLATVNVRSGNDDINSKASVSFPLISLAQYFSLVTNLAESIVPLNDIYKLEKDQVTITAKVDDKGSAEYFVYYQIKGKDQKYKLKVDKDPFFIDWVVSSYEGKAYPSEFIIKTKLVPPIQQTNHRRINWL
ncbi:hypothetical protein [Pedobacter suwonensis]|uniref:hypothetical protein n=1 Tax=Pedobacter suwonensis TaxID=332999 RepID=UPI00119D5266|nr:hypothetical protein [Pedobacter suwonensis]